VNLKTEYKQYSGDKVLLRKKGGNVSATPIIEQDVIILFFSSLSLSVFSFLTSVFFCNHHYSLANWTLRHG
jgi:hypothetical protein